MQSLSVSIVTYDTSAEMVADTLDALHEAFQHARARGLLGALAVDIVHNGPVSPAIEALSDRANVTFNPENVGYGRANNQVMLTSESDYHLILNPDVTMQEDALSIGIAHLVQHTDVVLLSPLAVDEDNQPAYLCKAYPDVLTLLCRALTPLQKFSAIQQRLMRYEQHEVHDRECADVEIVSGCFMLGRTTAMQKIGGFDPDFFLYFEDFDFSLRLARSGVVRYLKAMKIVHHGGQASRKGMRHQLMFASSAARFFSKWGWRLA